LVEQNWQTGFPRKLLSEDNFYRAIQGIHNRGDGTISPWAFSKSAGTDRMSVDWAEKSSPQETFDRWVKWGDDRGVASITAQLCWDNIQTIEFTPVKDDPCEPDNPAHCDVAGSRGDRVRKNLAKGADLLIPGADNGQQQG
jgi:hypothetical protein